MAMCFPGLMVAKRNFAGRKVTQPCVVVFIASLTLILLEEWALDIYSIFLALFAACFVIAPQGDMTFYMLRMVRVLEFFQLMALLGHTRHSTRRSLVIAGVLWS